MNIATVGLWFFSCHNFVMMKSYRDGCGGRFRGAKNRMFEIKLTDGAIEDLEIFSKSEQKKILEGLESQLTLDAAQENDDRKRLQSGGLAEWEVRLGNVRVFYDVDIQTGTVKIEAVGKRFR